MKKLMIIASLALLFAGTEAQASFYLHPHAGATIPMNGDSASYSLGGTLGYSWTDFFATEISYSRLFGTGSAGDGDLFSGQGVLSLPGVMITPYVSGGVGLYHADIPGPDVWEPMLLLGGGVMLSPVSFLSVGIGVNYAAVKNAPDFLEPAVMLGLHF